MRFIIIIGLFLWTTILNAQSNKTILRKDYIGNWYNPKTNQWSYGFFEKFAIINGKVSFYQDIFKTKKGYKISFNDSTNLNPVNLTLIKNTLSINKAKFNKFDKFLPKYIGNDTTTFYDSKFSTIDTTIISGYLRNNNSNKPFEIQIRNWINGKIENYYADLDSNGFFTIKLPLNNTSQVYMDWKRSDINDIITPGEKYFIYKDLTSGETLFFGDNARLHNEISKYHESEASQIR